MPDPLGTETPIARVDLREAVATRLRELILSGMFTPGQRLVETELAARFGTSRGPVRDGLADLQRSGLVKAVPRTGTFVVDLSATDVEELYSLRLALEELAVARAVRRATKDDLAAMRRALDDLAAAQVNDDLREVGEADMRFHRAIIEAAGHRRLREAWEDLADQTLLLMRELPVVQPSVQSDLGGHRDVLEAIADHDEPRAAEAMRAHLTAACEAMVVHRVDSRPAVGS